jgi:hypothetical protein
MLLSVYPFLFLDTVLHESQKRGAGAVLRGMLRRGGGGRCNAHGARQFAAHVLACLCAGSR